LDIYYWRERGIIMQKNILMENDLKQSRLKDDNTRVDNEEKPQRDQENEKVVKENEDLKDQKISEYGQTLLENGKKDNKIHLLSIIGEIEGHECLPQHNKTTKYEHVLPQLAAIEDSTEIDGLLILINTVGGDVEVANCGQGSMPALMNTSQAIAAPTAVSVE
jgi:ATP-dependent protease ClpP protease subunit